MHPFEQFLQQVVNGLSLGSIYALIAVGYTMVYGVLQLINFAHGDIFMVGAMVSLYAATGRIPAGMPLWLHALIIIAMAGFIAISVLRGISFRIAAARVAPLAVVYVVLIPLLYITSIISGHVPPSSWSTAAFALLVALLTCGTLGFTIERLAYRPLRHKPRINSLITAIGISLLLEFGGQHRSVFGPTPQPYPATMVPGIRQQFHFFGVVISRVDMLVLGVTLALMLLLTYIVLRTRTGLGLRAVSFRFDTAALMGVNTDRIISFTFVLGSTLAAVAGVLYAVKYPKVEPLMGLLPGVKAFVAAVFGGIGNITGAVAGAMILGLVEVLVVGYLPGGSQYRDGVAFVILIGILLVKPSGLFGKHGVEKV